MSEGKCPGEMSYTRVVDGNEEGEKIQRLAAGVLMRRLVMRPARRPPQLSQLRRVIIVFSRHSRHDTIR